MKALVVNMLVVLSIILQSIAPVVSATESHQVDVEHLKTEHSHEQDLTKFEINNNEALDNHEISDCHHCGHCSGSHLSWVFWKNVISPLATASSSADSFLSPPPRARKEPTLRPPIA